MSEFIRKEIKELVEIIFEQSQKLLNYQDGAPQIEVDIIKENIRKLYDSLDVLVNPSWTHNGFEVEQNIEKEIDDQVDKLIDIAEQQIEENKQIPPQQPTEQQEVISQLKEVVVEGNTSSESQKNPVKTTLVEEPKEELKPKQQTEAFPLKTTEAEKMVVSDMEAPNLGDQLQKKPISNLKSAIGINDKFQFINELFDGSMKVYNQAIDQMEEATNGIEAQNIYTDIAIKNNWDEENPAYLQLLDYINRRFN